MEAHETSPRVVAQVILRAPDGSSILDSEQEATDDALARHRPSDETIADATRRLEQLGFTVEATGPVSLTVSIDKDAFEDTFGTQLERRRKDAMATKAAGAEVEYFTATKPIDVPPELSDLVAAVVLPSRPELFP